MEKSLKTLAHGSFSTGSLRVIERLQQHGYQAFFVGGCVRDILTGHIPKDFDIVTDARPRQITALFSNGIVIGKRFTLVHIRWKDELVEVATFRKNDSGLDLTKDPEILKNDNVYGTLQDDLIRRDFAINALYYDPFAHKLIDECGGLRDIYNKEISTIGPDEHRFTEDPVRMIRAVRYAAKLGLSLSRGIQKGIATKSLLLAHVPKARLYEEYLKCFNHNKAKAVFDLMHKHKLIRLLIPKILAQPQLCKSVGSLLQKLQHINPDKEHMPALITYCFMAPVWATQSVKNLKTFESIFFSFNTLISIPRQIDIALKEVFLGIMPSSEEAHRYRLLAKMKVFKNHCHVLLKTSLKC
jgi:poly(A) polymerase